MIVFGQLKRSINKILPGEPIFTFLMLFKHVFAER